MPNKVLQQSLIGQADSKDSATIGERAKTIGERANVAASAAKISNPLAKEIRFDGQELVLGNGSCQALPAEELQRAVSELLDQNKQRSATAMISLHPRSAHRMLINAAGNSNNKACDFIAFTLDRGKPQSVWTDHQTSCKSNADSAQKYATVRMKLLTETQKGGTTVQSIAQLEQVANELNSLPLRLETQRLAALAKVAAGDATNAVSILASAAELAAKSSLPSIASDFWMTACQTSMRLENVEQARQCWKAAVANQLTAARSRPSDQMLPAVDTVFWEQSDKLKHPADQFPPELHLAFAPWFSRIGITPSTESNSQVLLWAAIAEFQLTTGQPHLAALSLKRAEVGASPSSKPWLQIALARTMAAQGQESVAVTILGSLNDSQEASVKAASLATLGSIKVQSGAYEQGSRFLIQALNTPNSGNWPGQLAAKADLALVRLIVGRIDEALPAVHAVQNEMMTSGRWQSLCQLLENEATILEMEKGKQSSKVIRERIARIEQL